MKVFTVILAAVVIIAFPGILLAAKTRKRSTSAPISGLTFQDAGYHPVSNLSDEELNWLLHFYDDKIKTRYHRVAGGTLVERPSAFQLQIEEDLPNRRLTDAQIDDIDSKLLDTINLIRPYLSDPYQKERTQQMEDMRQKLKQIKAL